MKIVVRIDDVDGSWEGFQRAAGALLRLGEMLHPSTAVCIGPLYDADGDEVGRWGLIDDEVTVNFDDLGC